VKVRILAIAASALLIASCGVTDRAGAAAIVGGHKISSADVAAQVKEVRFDIEHTNPELLQTIPTEALLSQMIIDRLVLEEILSYAAKDMNVNISDAEVASYRTDVFTQYGEDAVKAQLATQNGLAGKYVDDFMYDILVQTEIMNRLAPGQSQEVQAPALFKYLSEIVAKHSVEVSPRYGSWDPQTMRTVLGDTFLSTTTAAVTN
jgi:nicotinamide mononucleotide adenylyltransferase